jgi:hypothetical protein
MEAFTRSLDDFSYYPKNLVRQDPFEHNIQAYCDRLEYQKESLFGTARHAAVHFLDLHDGQQGRASPQQIFIKRINKHQNLSQRL